MKYYVYRHIRLDKNTPFYVGKGCKGRAYHTANRNKYWKNIVSKNGYIVEIVKYFEKAEDVYLFESSLIKLYKSFLYCEANITLGGEGPLGTSLGNYNRDHCKTLEFREIMSKVTSGAKNGMYGRKQSNLNKLKNSELAKKRVGKLNPKFKGYWVCGEYGKFESKGIAEKVTGSRNVYFRCKQSNSDQWSNWYFEGVK